MFNIIISLALGAIDGVTGTYSPEAGLGLLGGLYTLAVLLPSIAVTVRRLHDTGRSGWWFLIFLVPVIGAIVLLVFMVLDSKPGQNQYGENQRGQLPNEVAQRVGLRPPVRPKRCQSK